MRSTQSSSEQLRHLVLPSGVSEGLNDADQPTVTSGELKDFLSESIEWLEGRRGFVVVRGRDTTPSRTQCEADLVGLSRLFGRLVPQNKEGTIVREIRDRGTQVGEGRTTRYADTRYGGNLHTDGAEAPFPVPDFFALACVRQATRGGALRLIHIEDILARLEDHADILRALRMPFHFDRRGDEAPGGQRSVTKPIFFEEGGVNCITYFRRYIEIAHARDEVPPLTSKQREALDALDAITADPSLATEYKMQPAELIVVNNKRMIHDRTSFEDSLIIEEHRLLLRTWISSY